eukprot:scaffold94330_cov69-Phaeocystis_antarctica.AAC.4
MPLNCEKIFRGCAPDPLTPGQVRGVPEGGCRADVWPVAGRGRVDRRCLLCPNYQRPGLSRDPAARHALLPSAN